MTTQIEINKLEVKIESDGLSNIVHKIHFTKTDQETGELQREVIGVGDVALPDPENFTEYDDLTEELVMGWLDVDAALSSTCSNSLSPICELKDVPW